MIDKSVAALVLNSSLFAKIILLFLLVLSVAAWAIYLYKLMALGTVLRDLQRLFNGQQEEDRTAGSAGAHNHRGAPVTRMFQQGEKALKSALSALRAGGESLPAGATAPSPGAGHLPQADMLFQSELQQRLEITAEAEASQLAKGIPFLGTAITVSPFLGLLGTVWGVMQAFLNIGVTASADLAAVAPGIAEALITTIAGLGVAIPAVFCYNHLNNRLREVEDGLHRLAAETQIYFTKRWFHEKTKIPGALRNKRDLTG